MKKYLLIALLLSSCSKNQPDYYAKYSEWDCAALHAEKIMLEHKLNSAINSLESSMLMNSIKNDYYQSHNYGSASEHSQTYRLGIINGLLYNRGCPFKN